MVNLPATITTWDEVRRGNNVLIMRRCAHKTASWQTRIDRIVNIKPSSAENTLTITAIKPPDKGHKLSQEVTYLVERDMLVAVVDSEPERI